MLSIADRSIERPAPRSHDFSFADAVDLVHPTALPVEVCVEVEGDSITITVDERGHSVHAQGTTLGEADIDPADFRRISARCGQ